MLLSPGQRPGRFGDVRLAQSGPAFAYSPCPHDNRCKTGNFELDRRLSTTHDHLRLQWTATGHAQLLRMVACRPWVWPAPHPAWGDAEEHNRKFLYLHLAHHGVRQAERHRIGSGGDAPINTGRWSLVYTYVHFQQTIRFIEPESGTESRSFARAGPRCGNAEAEARGPPFLAS